jgi:AraC-like DNA-binding protein/quercetin dioxygenase-like cupin family protein
MAQQASISKIEIPNVGIHSGCPCYQTGFNRPVQHAEFAAGDTSSFHQGAHNIVFVMEGTIRVSMGESVETVSIGTNDMVFIPIGSHAGWEALEAGSMLVFRLDKVIENIPECHTFRFRRDTTPLSTRIPEGIHPLQANDRIRAFMDLARDNDRDGLKCVMYADLQVGQLLYLIQIYYPQEVYTRFYAAIFSPDVEFSEFVYKNWKRLATVTEMSAALNMSPQQFAARFRRVFGENPGVWIKEHKMRNIYLDICSSVKTLKEIAYEYNFPMSNLIRYCRMNFGQSPGAIRTQLAKQSKTGTIAPRQIRLTAI